jgi:hypothetical protein
MTKSKILPPDAPLVALAKIVNPRVAPLGAMVNFYRIENPDAPMQTGMVFSCGAHRYNMVKAGAPGNDMADQIVSTVNDWIADIRPASRWTEDQVEADSLDWNR